MVYRRLQVYQAEYPRTRAGGNDYRGRECRACSGRIETRVECGYRKHPLLERRFVMRGWGILLIVLGVGSFILPTMGYQFRLLSIFGEHTGIAGAVMAVIGVILLAVSFKAGAKPGAAPKT